MKSALFSLFFCFPLFCTAETNGVYKEWYINEKDNPPLHFCIMYHQMMLCDIAFVGRIIGLTNCIAGTALDIAPCFEVEQVLFGRSKSSAIAAELDSSYQSPSAMSFATDNGGRYLVFAITNNWWPAYNYISNGIVLPPHNVNPDSWSFVSNTAPAPDFFPRYTIYPNERCAYPVGEEGEEESIALVSNLIQIARAEKDRQKFRDAIQTIRLATNPPPATPLRQQLWRNARMYDFFPFPK